MDFSPTEAWPQHPEPCWRSTLDHARARGWSLKTFSGHAWGEVRCSNGHCTKKVYTTGKGSENVALGVRRLVDRCPHQSGLSGRLDLVEDRLLKATRLVDAAEALAERGKVHERIEMLDAGAELLDDALWDELGILIDDEDRYADAAAAALLDSGETAAGAGEALDLADERVRLIRNDLKLESPGVRRVKDLKVRADVLRDRIVVIRRL